MNIAFSTNIKNNRSCILFGQKEITVHCYNNLQEVKAALQDTRYLKETLFVDSSGMEIITFLEEHVYLDNNLFACPERIVICSDNADLIFLAKHVAKKAQFDVIVEKSLDFFSNSDIV